MDLLELTDSELKKLKIKDLKKLINDQKLFEIKKTDKKKDLIYKINEIKKDYEDSDSDESELEKVVEKKINKFEKKDLNKNYVIFNTDVLIDLCQILKELVEHCLIVFNKDGFKIKMVDRCLVSLIDINIKNCYDDSNFLEDEYKIVINMNELLKILDCKENNQKIKFLFTDEYLEIYYYTESEKYDKFKLHLLNENLVDEVNDFELNFDNKIDINSKYFSKMCNKIKKFDEKINIQIEDNNLKLSSLNKNIEINDVLNVKKENINITLLLKYILIFCKTEKFSSNVEILYSNNELPIKFIYNHDKLVDSTFEFIITPIIDNDDF